VVGKKAVALIATCHLVGIDASSKFSSSFVRSFARSIHRFIILRKQGATEAEELAPDLELQARVEVC